MKTIKLLTAAILLTVLSVQLNANTSNKQIQSVQDQITISIDQNNLVPPFTDNDDDKDKTKAKKSSTKKSSSKSCSKSCGPDETKCCKKTGSSTATSATKSSCCSHKSQSK